MAVMNGIEYSGAGWSVPAELRPPAGALSLRRRPWQTADQDKETSMPPDTPLTKDEAIAFMAKWADQYYRLIEELKRAHDVIAVLYAHMSRPPMKSKLDMIDLATDLTNRGLGDHDRTRTTILQEVTQ